MTIPPSPQTTAMPDPPHDLHTEAGYHQLLPWLPCTPDIRGELSCHMPSPRRGHPRRAQLLAARLPWGLRPWHRLAPEGR